MTTLRTGADIALLTVAATATTRGVAGADPTPPAITAPAGQQGAERGVEPDRIVPHDSMFSGGAPVSLR
ncbi:hypothetical protein AB0L57_18495 [Nocardia sp. NPDC052254]|uniref:hypothetical protein n=1 Tax=Nocardia sp. NPDC052254 TaxID=3155681 RepID=UPI00341EA2E0